MVISPAQIKSDGAETIRGISQPATAKKIDLSLLAQVLSWNGFIVQSF
jgi:hypothetical protein